MDVTVLWLKWKIEMHFAKNISLISILIRGGHGDLRCCGVDVFFNAVMR